MRNYAPKFLSSLSYKKPKWKNLIQNKFEDSKIIWSQAWLLKFSWFYKTVNACVKHVDDNVNLVWRVCKHSGMGKDMTLKISNTNKISIFDTPKV